MCNTSLNFGPVVLLPSPSRKLREVNLDTKYNNIFIFVAFTAVIMMNRSRERELHFYVLF
jgi:hypothetical protein